MKDKVREIVGQVFQLERGSIDGATSPDSVRRWDSLGHLQLIAALEREFGVRFQVRDIQSMDSVAGIEEILEMRGGGGSGGG
jgi:acyl carrier protein